MPHADAPQYLPVLPRCLIALLPGPNTSSRAFSARQIFRRLCSVRSCASQGRRLCTQRLRGRQDTARCRAARGARRRTRHRCRGRTRRVPGSRRAADLALVTSLRTSRSFGVPDLSGATPPSTPLTDHRREHGGSVLCAGFRGMRSAWGRSADHTKTSPSAAWGVSLAVISLE